MIIELQREGRKREGKGEEEGGGPFNSKFFF